MADTPVTTIIGHHRCIRAQRLDLESILDSLQREPSVQSLHLYCDELTWKKPLSEDGIVPLTGVGLIYIHIYARLFLTGLDAPKGLKFSVKDGNGQVAYFTLAIYFDICPAGLRIGHASLPDSLTPIARPGSSACAGIFVKGDTKPWPVSLETIVPAGTVVDPSKWATEIPAVPEGELTRLVNASNPNGSTLPTNSSLGDLLTLMFVWGSDYLCGEKQTESGSLDTALSMMRFIVRCTRASQTFAQLCGCAQRILNRIEFPRLYPTRSPFSDAPARFDVPVLEMKRYTDDLDRLVTLVSSLEEARDRLITAMEQEKTTADVAKSLSKQQADLATLIVKGLASLATPFVPNEENRATALEAFEDARRKQEDLLGKKENMLEASTKFQHGIDDYKSQLEDAKKAQEIKMLAKAGTAAFLAIFDPSKFIDLGLKFYETTKTLMGGDNAPGNFTRAIDQFQNKIPSLLRDLTAANAFMTTNGPPPLTNTQITEEELTKKISQLAAMPLDYFGLLRRWSEFSIDVEEAFLTLAGVLKNSAKAVDKDSLDDISGMREYLIELRKVVVRGKIAVEAKRVARDAMTTYWRGRAETIARENLKQQIQSSASDISEATFKDNVQKQNEILAHMKTQISIFKRQSFSLFMESLVSYFYRSGKSDFSFKFNAESSAVTYRAALDQLSQDSRDVDSAFRSKQQSPRDVKVDTKNAAAFRSDWKTSIQNDNAVEFLIPFDLPIFAGYYNFRLTGIYAEFEFEDSPKPDFAYDIEIGPQFIDKTRTGGQEHFTMKPFPLNKFGKGGDWSSSPTDPVYVLPTMCCEGRLLFSKSTMKEMKSFTTLAKITLTSTWKGSYDLNLSRIENK